MRWEIGEGTATNSTRSSRQHPGTRHRGPINPLFACEQTRLYLRTRGVRNESGPVCVPRCIGAAISRISDTHRIAVRVGGACSAMAPLWLCNVGLSRNDGALRGSVSLKPSNASARLEDPPVTACISFMFLRWSR
jgi:hypothetical protein